MSAWRWAVPTLAVGTTLAVGCAKVPVSPLATPRHARPQLFVYPLTAFVDRDVSASVLVPEHPKDLLCLTVEGPDALEHRRSCAATRLVGFTFQPSVTGPHKVIATLEHAGEVVRLFTKDLCVIGPEEDCTQDQPAGPPELP